MAVYCEKRTDDDLLHDIGDASRVLLVGCPICPNFSCVVQQHGGGPVSKMGVKGIKPLLLEKEMNKTAEWLQDKGVSVDSWTLSGMPASFCSISESTRKKLFDKAQDQDAIVVFSCESGHKCVEGIVSDKKVIAAMNANGLLRVVTKRRRRAVFVDRESAEIIRFTLE